MSKNTRENLGYENTDTSKGSNDPEVLKRALAAAYEVMNYMGDALNEMDACEPKDERFAVSRFRLVREALGIE